MAVDALRTLNRIELLNLLVEEQSRSLKNVMLNTTDIEEIIKFHHKQNVIFNAFLEKLGTMIRNYKAFIILKLI